MADSTDKDYAEWLQLLFKDYYIAALPHMERKEFIQKMFDGDIDDINWPTMSEVYIPLMRSTVKSMMPEVIEYIFPRSGFVSLIPQQGGMSRASVNKFEKALDNVIQYKMQCRKHAIPIIQDGLKFGAGYGIVEKAMYTAEESRGFSIMDHGKPIMKQRGMQISATPQLMPRLRYLRYENVIPSPDASSPEDASCVIVVDYYSEAEFRALYNSQAASDVKVYKGNPDEIIKETSEKGIATGVWPHYWNMMLLGGETTESLAAKYRTTHQISQRNQSVDGFKVPIMIPVLKFFFKQEHVWLANGDTIIYHDKESFETLRCPVIKASPDLDSGNWWALSDVAASRDISLGINMYQNAMMDLLTQYLRPTIVYDAARYAGEEVPRHEPWGSIPVNGKVGDAISTMAAPPIPPGLMQYGGGLELQYNQVNGVPLNGQQSPGLVRGGSNALEGLLQTTNGRREFAGLVFDMGFVEPLIKNVIIHMQTLPQDTYEYVDLDQNDYVQNRITLNDHRYAFDVNLDLREKVRHSINEKMVDITMYQQVYRNNPRIRQDVAIEKVIGDKEKARELIADEEEYQKNLEEMQRQMNPQQPMTPAEQGMAGRTQGGA